MPDAVLQDLRYALRAIRRSPGFAAVAILSLALGIGANTAIFSLIDSLILKTLPVAHPEQLLQVTSSDGAYFTNPIWEQIRGRQDVFSGVFAYGGNGFNLAAGGEARNVRGSYTSGQFFDALGLHAIVGRTFTMADDKRGCPGTAVLSHGFWQREYGGRADVVGKTISLNKHPFEILGVLAPGFTGMDVGSEMDIYVPLCAEKIIRGEFKMCIRDRFGEIITAHVTRFRRDDPREPTQLRRSCVGGLRVFCYLVVNLAYCDSVRFSLTPPFSVLT